MLNVTLHPSKDNFSAKVGHSIDGASSWLTSPARFPLRDDNPPAGLRIAAVQSVGGEIVSVILEDEVTWANVDLAWSEFSVGGLAVYDAQISAPNLMTLELKDEVNIGDAWHFGSDHGQATPPLDCRGDPRRTDRPDTGVVIC